MAVGEFHEFGSREELAQSLAAKVAGVIDETGGTASIALSGGSTPKLFLSRLAPVQACQLLMVDDRWVPVSSERSNEAMIRNILGIDQSTSAKLLPLYSPNHTIEEASKRAERCFRELNDGTLDLCVLGMGTDGHTASWFPHAPGLTEATKPETHDLYIPAQSTDAEPRITMTLPAVASARQLILHIEGDEKRKVYEQALGDGPADDLPIRYVLRHPTAKLEVYWAP